MTVILKGDRDSFSSIEFIVEAYKRLLIRKMAILLAFYCSQENHTLPTALVNEQCQTKNIPDFYLMGKESAQ